MNNMSHKPFNRKFLFFIPIGIAFVFLLPAAVMWLWNTILPGVIGVKTITYWQAAGIFVLSKLLFGHFGGGGGHRRKTGKEKGPGFSEEDKQKFREEMQKRFG
jgi:Ca2+/H+ antiporter, TMEM165/GDT1 family